MEGKKKMLKKNLEEYSSKFKHISKNQLERIQDYIDENNSSEKDLKKSDNECKRINGIETERIGRLDGAEYKNEQKIATGEVVAGIDKANAYVFYNKVSGGSSAENVVDGSTGKIDTAAQVENVGDYTGAVKNEVNPKTGDKSYTIFWIICVLISAGLVIYTGSLLFKNEKKSRK